jgi:hypothetical protein
MNTRAAFLSAITLGSLLFTSAKASAVVVDAEEVGAHANATPRLQHPWTVRAEGGLVNMRDNWLGLPGLEVGLTVGRDLTRWFSVELTGNARDVDQSRGSSWSALAVGRAYAFMDAGRHHALTAAAGPFVEIANPVHGTIPFAHAELAYVYRSSFGLTALAGAGPSMALASSSYREPPPSDCSSGGDAIVLFCGGLGPSAHELHAGDLTAQARVALGWQF